MDNIQVMGSIASTIATDQIHAWQTNHWMIPAAIVAIAVGYIYYVFQTIILLKEHKSLGPIWMHCFFAALRFSSGTKAASHRFGHRSESRSSRRSCATPSPSR